MIAPVPVRITAELDNDLPRGSLRNVKHFKFRLDFIFCINHDVIIHHTLSSLPTLTLMTYVRCSRCCV